MRIPKSLQKRLEAARKQGLPVATVSHFTWIHQGKWYDIGGYPLEQPVYFCLPGNLMLQMTIHTPVYVLQEIQH